MNEIVDPIGKYRCNDCNVSFTITSHSSTTKEKGMYFCPVCGERCEGPLHDKTIEMD